MKYRKKPVVIEAIQFDGENGRAVIEWIRLGEVDCGLSVNEYITIETLEGCMKATLGDWIIKGIAGEFYPCKDSIFTATYERVSESEAQG